jgi:hypothetical protein
MGPLEELGPLEEKELEEELRRKEQKQKIDRKVSTKFQINPSTNGFEKCIQGDMGSFGDQPTDGRSLL